MAEDRDPLRAFLRPAPGTAGDGAQQTVVTAIEALAQSALPTPNSSARPSIAGLPETPISRKPTSPPAAPGPVPGKPRPIMSYRSLAPAPPTRLVHEEPTALTIFDLPAELRVEIYKLVLERVTVHILPVSAETKRNCPHALIRTSRQVRIEVLPIIHSLCPIRANVTDFDFGGMLVWIQRIPPSQQANLCKNQDLRVSLCTTSAKPNCAGVEMRKWLHMRADPHRPQPAWNYSGAQAQNAVANDLRRRVKRMTEPGKRAEFQKMLDAIKVHPSGPRSSS